MKDPGITLARVSLTSVTRVVTYASLPSVNHRVTSVRVRGTNISLNTVQHFKNSDYYYLEISYLVLSSIQNGIRPFFL